MKNFSKQQGRSIGINISNSVHSGGCCSSADSGELMTFSNELAGYSIEQHLFSFSGRAPFDFLWSSWIIEKENYQKWLSTIPLTFPDYTSHGTDHSKVILSRIEALLGKERIMLLSPTDAWLLLQCAYSHDIGMCVTADEKAALFMEIDNHPAMVLDALLKDDYFRNYLLSAEIASYSIPFHMHDRFASYIRFLSQMIQRNDREEIAKYINQLESEGYSLSKQIYRTVIKQYFRSHHAKLAREKLIQEAQASTMNNTLPVRLRKIVAEINYCHGAAWKEIVKRLPRQDNGFHTDYVHPQFIAALIRLGDLLDMDSNRFNPYQIDSAGVLSKTSACHLLKHMAITKFMVDTNWIDIEARYRFDEAKDFLLRHYFLKQKKEERAEDEESKAIEKAVIDFETRRMMEESASVLRDWISWLHDDLKEFSTNWNAIVPENMTGFIAALRTNDIYFNDNDIPVESDELELRYSISPRRASQIIEGSELYNDSLTFFRELVQNAIDATKRQVFRSIKAQNNESDIQQAFLPRQILRDTLLPQALKKYKVSVSIEYMPCKPGQPCDFLDIVIRDYGIGITYEKLKQMRHIGAVSLSEEEKRELNEMPQCLQPTGEYGIGMQSAFTVVDSFEIVTWPRYEENKKPNYKRVIRLICPELGGDIVNEEFPISPGANNRFGTDVIIHLPLTQENVRNLMQYKELNTFAIRSDRILAIDGVIDRIKRYILETFSDDMVGMEFFFIRADDKACGKEQKTTIASFSFPEYQRHSFSSDGNSYLFVKEGISPDKPLCYWYNSRNGEESVLLTLQNKPQSRVRLFFKGIAVSSQNNRYNPSRVFRIPGVDLQINIMSGSAAKMLEISRDYIKPAGYKPLRENVQHALTSFYLTIFHCIDSSDGDEWKDLREYIFQLFFQNPAHMLCFCQVLEAFHEPMNPPRIEHMAELLEAGYRALLSKERQGMAADFSVPTMSILYGSVYIGNMASLEALHWIKTGNIWFTDYRFEDSFCSDILIRQENSENMCAIYDNLSGIYDLTYGKVRIIQDMAWQTQYIRLYTLVKADSTSPYPEFVMEEYYRLCLLIINEYINRYLLENDTYKKEEIGNYILSFPAVKEYQSIAVNQFPAESPDELAARYSRFIICPCNVKKLTDYFRPDNRKAEARISFLSDEKREALFNDEAVKELIVAMPLVRQDMETDARVNMYKKLFAFFDGSR